MKPRGIPQASRQKSISYNSDGSPKECTVWGQLALVLRASRCAGVAPLRLHVAGSDWRAAASPPLAALQRCVMAVLIGLAIAAIILDLREEPTQRIRINDTALKAFVAVFDIAMVMSIASLAAYPGRERMERLIRVMNKLEQINKDLNNDPTKNSQRVGCLVFVCLLTWTFTGEVIEIYLHMEWFLHTGKNWFIMLLYTSHYIAIVQGLLVLMQWSCGVLVVHDAAAVLNRHLLRLCHVNLMSEVDEIAMLEDFVTPSKSLVDCFTERLHETDIPEGELTANPSQVRGMIRRLALSHEQIGEVMHQMNAGHGVILVIMLLCKFLHLIQTPYYFLLRLWHALVGAVTLLVFWTVVHISMLLLAVEACHWTQGQRETTKFLLSKLLVHLGTKCKRLSQEVDRFAKQTLLTNVQFMPLGLYTLARPLMATILGGVTTYLVIIIQFQKVFENI